MVELAEAQEASGLLERRNKKRALLLPGPRALSDSPLRPRTAQDGRIPSQLCALRPTRRSGVTHAAEGATFAEFSSLCGDGAVRTHQPRPAESESVSELGGGSSLQTSRIQAGGRRLCLLPDRPAPSTSPENHIWGGHGARCPFSPRTCLYC